MKITYHLSLLRRNIGTFSLSHHFAGGFFFSLESSAVKLKFSRNDILAFIKNKAV